MRAVRAQCCLRVAAAALASAILGTAAGAATDAPYLFVLARLLAEEGEVTDARGHLQRAVVLEPADPYLRLEYAALLANLGRWEEASQEATEARRLAPDNAEVLRAFGQIHLYRGREDPAAIDRAREAFEDLRARTPPDLESQLALARIYFAGGRFDDAVAVYREVLAYWPGQPAARKALVETLLRAGRAAEAEEALVGFLATDPSALDFRLRLADLELERGDFEGAIEVLEAAGEKTQDEPEVARRLALAYYRIGENARALERVEAWIAREGDDRHARLLQSFLLTALDRDAEAAAVLEELQRARPEDLEVATLLVRHHTARQEWDAALAVSAPLLEDGVDADSAELALLSAEALRGAGQPLAALDRLALVGSRLEQWPRATALSAEILFELDRAPEAEEALADLLAEEDAERLALAAAVYQRGERYSASIGVLERLLAVDPARTEALFWLGAAYERTRDYARAEESFRRLLAAEPDFAPALNYLGYMWADRGTNLEEALALVERAVALEPDNGAYIDSLGWAHFQRGDYAAAQDHLERAAELVGDDAIVLEHLGDLYRALGRLEDAGAAYWRALELNDENVQSLQGKLESLPRPD